MKKLSDLDIGHAYAPGYEPPFFKEIVEAIMYYTVEYIEVIWFLIFLVIVYLFYRLLRMAWRGLRHVVRSDFDDDDELEEDARARYARAQRKRKRRTPPKAEAVQE